MKNGIKHGIVNNLKRTYLCRTNNNYYIIEGIDSKQEENIDKNDIFIYNSLDGTKTIKIPKNQIAFYGDIDLNNKEDINIIKKYDIVAKDLSRNFIPTDFNYETGEFKLKNGKITGCGTTDALEWFKFCYYKIGKPKKIIVYKQSIRK